MAIFHAHKTSYSRGRGYQATKLAAYRACERLHDHRTKEMIDYSRKRALLGKGIVDPQGKAVEIDRETLWNDVEAIERRKKSIVAQEWEIALPNELTKEEQLALARDLAAMLAEADNTLVDYAVHKPHKRPVMEEGAEPKANAHVHILMPTRQWQEGKLSKARVAEYLSTEDRKKAGITTKRAEDMTDRRQMIAACINRHLLTAGVDERVDHRTLAEQGIDRLPQIHVGVAAAAKARRGEYSDRVEQNAEIIAINRAMEQAAAQPTPQLEPEPKKQRLSPEELRAELRQNLAGPAPKPRPE